MDGSRVVCVSMMHTYPIISDFGIFISINNIDIGLGRRG